MKLEDDNPLWEQHSGGDGHCGPEWGPADGPRAATFYGALTRNAELISDLLMDHAGEQMSSDWIAAQISGPGLGRTGESARRSVSGASA